MRTSSPTAILVGLILAAHSTFAQSSEWSSSSPTGSSNSSAAAPSSTASAGNNTNPLIPSAISKGCSNFLADLNGNEDLKTCTTPVTDALKAFSPVSGGDAPSVNETLNKLCASGEIKGCSDGHVRSLLSWFSGNCSDELHSDNQVVRSTYDALYVLQPMRSALCSRDTKSTEYCVLEIVDGNPPSNGDGSSLNSTIAAPNGTSTGDNALSDPGVDVSLTAKVDGFSIQVYAGHAMEAQSLFQNVAEGQTTLQRRGETAIAPNATTFREGNVPFLFLSPDMPSQLLCTQCTKTIMLRYLQWESSIHYASGLASSGFLGGQNNLWNGLSAKCGSGFTNEIQAGTSAGGLKSAAGLNMDRSMISLFSAAGLAAVAALW